MFTHKKNIEKLNSYNIGILGIFGLDSNNLKIQMDENTLVLIGVSLFLTVLFFIYRKMTSRKLVKPAKIK